MARTVPIAEAKDQLSSLLAAVEAGEVVTLTRRGKPVAVLVSAGDFDEEDVRRTEYKRWYRQWHGESALTEADVDEWMRLARETGPDKEPVSW